MKIATIVGARPQFVKAAAVNRVIRQRSDIEEIMIHTGQHYDENMSKIFFDELAIPHPQYNLEVGSGLHGEQTGQMLIRIEQVLIEEKPDWVLIYGDTNSTVAGALAATKLHIPVAHVEAGLRSFNRAMPEEINRIASDHISDLLLVPTKNAMQLLDKEGLAEKAYFCGDVMYDSVLFYREMAHQKHRLSDITALKSFYLATVHRAENTDDPQRLQNIFTALSQLDQPVILPLHPRTRKKIANIDYSENIHLIEPVGYLQMLLLLEACSKVLTDSGGLQKEAYFMQKPCITLRDETEWVETLDNHWNFIVGADVQAIFSKVQWQTFGEQADHYGDGHAAEKIIQRLLEN